VTKSDGQIVSIAAFEQGAADLRPEIHRYLSRMTGSVIDGEDVLQMAFMKAFEALERGDEVRELRPWMFRIAHNAALDYLRARKREADHLDGAAALPEAAAVETPSPAEMVEGLRPFLALPARQRSTVILRDIFGYSAAETADLTGATTASVKAALHRGRETLRQHRAEPAAAAARAPLSPESRRRLGLYARLFNDHSFDELRDMLSAEVRLELVGRVDAQGREKVGNYFGNYSRKLDWRMAPGQVEGRDAILVFDLTQPEERPAYFILLDYAGEELGFIRDFRYARYAMADAEWELAEGS